MKLQTILVSTRPGRSGPSIATWFHNYAREHGVFEAALVDLADYNLPIFDEPKHPRLRDYDHEHTKKWSATIAAGDAYVFVTPEYNYGPTPAFINALTYLAREWAYKPCAFVTYGGVFGGQRALQIERLAVTHLKMMPIPESVSIPMFTSLIDSDKVFKPNELITMGADVLLDELAKWAGTLKQMHA